MRTRVPQQQEPVEDDNESASAEDEHELLSGEEESESEGDAGDHSSTTENDSAHGSKPTGWPTSPSVSYFLSSIIIGASLLIVGLVSLSGLDRGFDRGSAVLRQYQYAVDRLTVRNDFFDIFTVEPLAQLTGSSALRESVASELAQVLQDSLHAFTSTDVNATLLSDCVGKIDTMTKARAIASTAVHAELATLQSERSSLFASAHVSTFTLGQLALSAETVALSVVAQLTVANEALALQVSQLPLAAQKAALVVALRQSFNNALSNLSNALLSQLQDTHAAEAIVLRSTAADFVATGRFSVSHASTPPEQSAEVVAANSSLAFLNSTFDQVTLLAAVASGGRGALQPNEQLLLEVFSNATLRELAEGASSMIEATIAARRTYIALREEFLSNRKLLELQSLPDLDAAVPEASESEELQHCIELVMNHSVNQVADAARMAEGNETALRIDADGSTSNDVRAVRIAAAVCLSPLLGWLLYALGAVTAQVGDSPLPYQRFVLWAVLFCIVVAGMGAAVANVTISALQEPLDLSLSDRSISSSVADFQVLQHALEPFTNFLLTRRISETQLLVLPSDSELNDLSSRLGLTDALRQFLDSAKAALVRVGPAALNDELSFNRVLYDLMANTTNVDLLSSSNAACAAYAACVAALVRLEPFASVDSTVGIVWAAAGPQFAGLAATLSNGASCAAKLSVSPTTELMLQSMVEDTAYFLPNFAMDINEAVSSDVVQAASDLRLALDAVQTGAQATVSLQQSLWFDQQVRHRRLVVWLTAGALVFSQFGAYALSWQLFSGPFSE